MIVEDKNKSNISSTSYLVPEIVSTALPCQDFDDGRYIVVFQCLFYAALVKSIWLSQKPQIYCCMQIAWHDGRRTRSSRICDVRTSSTFRKMRVSTAAMWTYWKWNTLAVVELQRCLKYSSVTLAAVRGSNSAVVT